MIKSQGTFGRAGVRFDSLEHLKEPPPQHGASISIHFISQTGVPTNASFPFGSKGGSGG